MSLATLAEVRALVSTGLSDADLQTLIDREEAILAGEIGALASSRVDVITITDLNRDEPISLPRQTTSVAVTEANVAITDVRLAADGRTVQRLTSGWSPAPWLGVVEITSTPSDSAKVKSWVIEIIRARLAETAFDSETAGDYTYSRGTRTHAGVLAAAMRDILGRSSGITSVRLTSDLSPGPAWAGSVRP